MGSGVWGWEAGKAVARAAPTKQCYGIELEGAAVDISSLAGDAGITHSTAKTSLSVLEASFLVHRLRPFYRNIKRRLVKTPKMHFFDSGLACDLLGIHNATELARHPLRGAIFEILVASEIVKAHLHRGQQPRISCYRDQRHKPACVPRIARVRARMLTRWGGTVRWRANRLRYGRPPRTGR